MADFGGDSFVLFLSTPSARRATAVTQTGSVTSVNFYPRPPRGGRRASTARRLSFMQFLSTPSARRATRTSCTRSLPMRFLSTPSARRATYRYATYKATAIFLSTPSARRATRASSSRRCHSMYFYPRPPRGGRHSSMIPTRYGVTISIHALREEGDHQSGRPDSRADHFYPRPPRGGRLKFADIHTA